MATAPARLVLTISAIALATAGIAWRLDATADPRSDLVGAAVVTPPPASVTSSTTTATTVAPAPIGIDPPAPPAAVPAPAVSDPTGLSIPSLDVDSGIVAVGLEPDGSLEIPGASEVGWYRHGPMPGEAYGSAVLAAHVDYGGAPGVFFDLRALRPGAGVAVTDEDGRVFRYVVAERFQVDKDELPVDELFRSTGPPTLTLITCGGAFDRSAGHYTDNIVVRATLLHRPTRAPAADPGT